MNDLIHSWLDGEVPLDALPAEERERALRIQDWLRTAEDLHEATAPGVADRVMNALPPGAPSPAAPWKRLLQSVGSRIAHRTVRLRHAAAFAGFCLLVGFGMGVLGAPDSGGVPTTDESLAGAEGPAVFVRFEVEVAGAESVHLAGSFSGWEPRYALSPAGGDRWTVMIPLDAGVHDYVFVVDGERHVLDPTAPRIDDGFGSFSNRIALLTSAT